MFKPWAQIRHHHCTSHQECFHLGSKQTSRVHELCQNQVHLYMKLRYSDKRERKLDFNTVLISDYDQLEKKPDKQVSLSKECQSQFCLKFFHHELEYNLMTLHFLFMGINLIDSFFLEESLDLSKSIFCCVVSSQQPNQPSLS